jgi:hypothetical protein
MRGYRHTIFFSIAILVFFVVFSNFAMSLTIAKPEKITFSPNLLPQEKPFTPYSIAVTEDWLFAFTDYQTQGLYTFQQRGDILAPANIPQGEFGSNGAVKLVGPAYSSYAKGGQLVVADLKLSKIFYFLRDTGDWSKFNYQREFPCLRGCTALKLTGEKIVVAGAVTVSDKNYTLYSIDTGTGQVFPLLSPSKKYGIPEDNIKSGYNEKIQAIGLIGYIDSWENIIFHTWEGGRIVILTTDGRILKSFDAQKTANYFKPQATPTLIANRMKNPMAARAEKLSFFSYIKGVFSTSRYFYVVYEGPVKNNASSAAWLQQYDHNGIYMGECTIPNLPVGGNKMFWFDKENKILYSLSPDPSMADYFVLKYKIAE